jgi:hypothetical protein
VHLLSSASPVDLVHGPRALLETVAADYGTAPDNSFELSFEAVEDGLKAQLAVRRVPAGPGRALTTRHDNKELLHQDTIDVTSQVAGVAWGPTKVSRGP